MSEKVYVVPLLLSISAESYDKAVEEAKRLSEDLSNSDTGMGYEVETYFEHDNIGQRVLYLHPEEDPDYENTKGEDEEE